MGGGGPRGKGGAEVLMFCDARFLPGILWGGGG